jgi:hypothetical protein
MDFEARNELETNEDELEISNVGVVLFKQDHRIICILEISNASREKVRDNSLDMHSVDIDFDQINMSVENASKISINYFEW